MEFVDALSDSQVYLGVRITGALVNLLVTGRRNGDCDVSFWPVQCKRLADGLERAAEQLGSVGSYQEEVEVVGVEGVLITPAKGPIVRTSITVGVYKGAVHLRLAWEGNPGEEDDADTFLDAPTCKILAECLSEARRLTLLSST